jgi:hypothetical protein
MTNSLKKALARHIRLLVGTWLVAITVTIGLPASAFAFTNSPHQLVAATNGQCLTFNTFLDNVYERLYTSQCAQAWTPQPWDLNYVGDGYYNIRSHYDPSRCVDVFAYNQDLGARVVTWTCIPGATNQQWSFTYDSYTNARKVRARHSGKCLQSSPPWVVQGTYCTVVWWQPYTEWYVTN